MSSDQLGIPGAIGASGMTMNLDGDVVAAVEGQPEIVRGNADGANCGQCPFARGGVPFRPVFSEGSERPIWIIVGESPGSLESSMLRPFVGPSGKLVNDALGKIGVSRNSLHITNSALCQPQPGSTEDAKRKARECCAPRLKKELAKYPGRGILSLGAHASQGFIGDKFSITQMAGAYYQVDFDGTGTRDLIPTIHPAAILRGGTGKGGGGSHTTDLAFWNLIYDAQKINLLARGRDIKFTHDIEIEATDPKRAELLIEGILKDVRRLKYVAVDTETYVDDPKRHTALAPINARMSAIGLATAERGISLAWGILTPRAKRFIGAMFTDQNITTFMHNATYDMPVLKKHGLPITGPFECTLLKHHSIFPGLAHGLQRVGTQFFALAPWKSEFRLGHGSVEELLGYNAKDTLCTARINAPLTLIMKRTQSEKTYEVDLAMAKTAAQMHLDGIPINREVNEHLRIGFKTHIDKAREDLLAKAADPRILDSFLERLAFEQSRKIRKSDPLDLTERMAVRRAAIEKKGSALKIDSGDHVVAFLRACGVPLSLQTASGKISTKKDILESFVAYPEVRALLTYRENAKLLSTYVERLFDRVQPDGKVKYGFCDMLDRVHTRWSVFKLTGRWGSEAPVMQNVPKADKKKGRPNLRSQVVAPKGRILIAFDAKQLEARILALLSGDPFLLDIFAKDKDIHSEFARIVWPDFDTKHPDERKVLRDMIKRPEYGAYYGGSIDTLWKAVVRDYPNVGIGMIGQMVSMMKNKMPGIAAWHQRMMLQADREGMVYSAILRRRREFPIKQYDLSEVVNFPVQSTGADIIDLGLMDIMPRLPKNAFPILQIHDALVFEGDEDDADLLKKLVVTSFTREVTYEGRTVHFPVDAKAGKSWAEVN
jgi:uracil-DNA glycosylase family 4